jgi:2-dehydropantoate 2-reductase
MTQDQVIGALIYSANRIEAPGIVRNNSPAANRIEIGRIEIGAAEPAGLAGLRGAFEEAGIACEAVGDIREAVWLKLLANMSGSAIALATGNESSVSRKDPALGEVYLRVLREGLAISAAHGYRLDHRIEPEAALARTLDHRPSLVQDYEQRRPMEIGEIVLGPQAFARAAGLATPSLDVLAAIVTRLARDRGLYPSP